MNEQGMRLGEVLERGPVRMGQLCLWEVPGEGYRLCHTGDFDRPETELECFREAGRAREIAKYAGDGSYRSLRAGADLRNGWLGILSSLEELVRAIELIYPAALGQWLAAERFALRMVSLRETLGRQTGMYRFAQRISEAGMEGIVEARCRAKCLRKVLWPEGRGAPSGGPVEAGAGEIPLWCSEACALLIADARTVSKEEAEKAAAGGGQGSGGG